VAPEWRAPLPAVFSWLSLAGIAGAAGGLGWDAVLHAHDPLLAQHEGVFSASNPAHVVMGAGLLVALVGQIGVTCVRLSGAARRVFIAGVAVSGVGLAAAVGWSAQTTATRTAAAQHFVSTARDGILQYQDPSIALRDGYQPVTPLNWPIVEWVNPTYTRAGRVLDLKRPERLMYISAPGGPILAGAMFVMPTSSGPIPNAAGGLAHWHQHRDLCYLPNGTIAGTNGYGQPCPDGSAARPTPPMLHVWIVSNPQGAFAEDMSPASIASLITGG
jgi:hypothetical protein